MSFLLAARRFPHFLHSLVLLPLHYIILIWDNASKYSIAHLSLLHNILFINKYSPTLPP
jgi:hypothetical protein